MYSFIEQLFEKTDLPGTLAVLFTQSISIWGSIAHAGVSFTWYQEVDQWYRTITGAETLQKGQQMRDMSGRVQPTLETSWTLYQQYGHSSGFGYTETTYL